MRTLVVIDGAAETIESGRQTTLESSHTPFLSSIAKQGSCGLFDPRDRVLNVIKTEIIVSTLLGIRPNPWPGRAYFEVMHVRNNVQPPAACCFFRYHLEDHPVPKGAEMLVRLGKHVADLAASLNVFCEIRKYERTMSTHLAWVDSAHSLPIEAMKRITALAHGIQSLLPAGIELHIDEEWHGEMIMHPKLPFPRGLLAHSVGCLAGLAFGAGINVLAHNAQPHNVSLLETLENQVHDALSHNSYNTVVLYFKEPDWASHIGDGEQKRRLIEAIDAIAGRIITRHDLLSRGPVMILSDHCSELGKQSAACSPSLYVMATGSPSASSFNERAVSIACNSQIIHIETLSQMFNEKA